MYVRAFHRRASSAERLVAGSPGYFGDAVYTFYWLPTVQAVSKRLKELDGKSGFDDYVKARKRIRQAATVDGIKITRWWSSWKAAKNTQAWVAQVGRKEKVNAKLAEMGYTKSECVPRFSLRREDLLNSQAEQTRPFGYPEAQLDAAVPRLDGPYLEDGLPQVCRVRRPSPIGMLRLLMHGTAFSGFSRKKGRHVVRASSRLR